MMYVCGKLIDRVIKYLKALTVLFPSEFLID